LTKKFLSVTGARACARGLRPQTDGPIQFLKMSKERQRLQLRDGIFEHVLSVQQRLQKTKIFMSVTGRARARAGFARKRIVRFYCSLLQFEVDGVSSGMSYHELFYDLYFLSYSRLKLREGCQIPKKAIFRLFCSICTVLFLYFSL